METAAKLEQTDPLSIVNNAAIAAKAHPCPPAKIHTIFAVLTPPGNRENTAHQPIKPHTHTLKAQRGLQRDKENHSKKSVYGTALLGPLKKKRLWHRARGHRARGEPDKRR